MNASAEINRNADPTLADAFAIFTAAAESLERSYQQLRMEASHLHQQRESARRLIALAEMSSVLAHEIRNPLGTMELLAELLAGCDELNPGAKGWVKELQAGIRSLSATVNNVLRFHTLGAPALVQIPLAPLLRDAVDFVRPLGEKAGVNVALEENLGETEIAGSSSELQQVILNLAINAFQHTEADGEFRIQARREHRPAGQFAVVEASDTGRGIKAEHLPRIFEPGFTTRQSPGLGLTICRKIIQQHGGGLFVRSQVGQGTTFTMELPVA
jgi:two-component system sensor histidine kinase FlrB